MVTNLAAVAPDDTYVLLDWAPPVSDGVAETKQLLGTAHGSVPSQQSLYPALMCIAEVSAVIDVQLNSAICSYQPPISEPQL